MNGPFVSDCNNENDYNSDDMFNHMWEYISKIKSMPLVKTLGNKSRFVSVNSFIRIFLNSEDPFATNDLSIRGNGDKGPSVIVNEGILFFLHRWLQLQVDMCLLGGICFSMSEQKYKVQPRLSETRLCFGLHIIKINKFMKNWENFKSYRHKIIYRGECICLIRLRCIGGTRWGWSSIRRQDSWDAIRDRLKRRAIRYFPHMW